MRRIFTVISLLVIVLAAACTNVSPPATSTPEPAATPVPTQEAGAVTTAAFFLNVAEPQDETVVRVSSVHVKGSTTADAVVSVNGQVVDVDADGKFTALVNLQEGPNSIDVIASDFQTDTQWKVVNLVYVP